MLTWAIAWLIRHDKVNNGLWMLAAMVGDCSIATDVAKAAIAAFHH